MPFLWIINCISANSCPTPQQKSATSFACHCQKATDWSVTTWKSLIRHRLRPLNCQQLEYFSTKLSALLKRNLTCVPTFTSSSEWGNQTVTGGTKYYSRPHIWKHTVSKNAVFFFCKCFFSWLIHFILLVLVKVLSPIATQCNALMTFLYYDSAQPFTSMHCILGKQYKITYILRQSMFRVGEESLLILRLCP